MKVQWNDAAVIGIRWGRGVFLVLEEQRKEKIGRGQERVKESA